MTMAKTFLLLATTALTLVGISSHANGQDGSRANDAVGSAAKPVGVSAVLAKAIAVGDLRVKLQPITPSGSTRLGWSPKGSQVPLLRAGDHWIGRIRLKQKTFTVRFRLIGEQGSDAELAVDTNVNGKFEQDEQSRIKARLSRGKYWYSSTSALELADGDGGKRSYPIAIWYVDDPEEETKRKIIRWSRRGWHEGQFKFLGFQGAVLVTDRLMDGVFDKRDAWGLGATATAARSYKNSSASIDSHNWLNGIAFQVKEVDSNGRFVTIRAFDLGRSEEEDRKQSDPYAKDRAYPRAKTPVRFSKDLAAAMAQAKKENKRVLLDFVTTWCGPCAVMDRLVYTAQPIVDKQSSTIFVKLDGDEEKALRKKYAVRGYPTIIVLDADGKIEQTAVGYQGVERLLKMLP